MVIEYWADFVCPFSYIGRRNMEKALMYLDMEPTQVLRFHSFELDPNRAELDAPQDNRQFFMDKYEYSGMQADMRFRTIERMAFSADLKIDLKNSILTNTREAHRLTKYAQDKYSKTVQEKLISYLFGAVFQEGKAISSLDTLKEIGSRAGIKPEEIEALFKSDAYAQAIQADEHEAGIADVTSVPYFKINEEVSIPGALPAKKMAHVIQGILEKEQRKIEEQKAQEEKQKRRGLKLG